MEVTLVLLSIAVVSYILADILRHLAKKQDEKEIKHPRHPKVMYGRVSCKTNGVVA
jgi:hypothetical protein